MEADLQEALDTDAVVLGMDLEGDPELFQEARDLGVKIVSSKVIYTIEEDLVRLVALKKNKGMLQVNRGTCSVAEVFRVSNGREKIRAAGVRVDSGRIGKKLLFEVEREGKVVANGLIVTMMKRFKKEVQELQRGEECTLIFQDYEGYEKGDLLRCYELTKPE
jgi:translation initiation factor IF-2